MLLLTHPAKGEAPAEMYQSLATDKPMFQQVFSVFCTGELRYSPKTLKRFLWEGGVQVSGCHCQDAKGQPATEQEERLF